MSCASRSPHCRSGGLAASRYFSTTASRGAGKPRTVRLVARGHMAGRKTRRGRQTNASSRRHARAGRWRDREIQSCFDKNRPKLSVP